MRSPLAAIGWEFRQRHRWGLIAVAAYLFVLALIKLFILGLGERVSLAGVQTFALVVALPLTATFLYFLAVFSFGLTGDLAARRSMYPARLLTLPVTTGALAGWPMLYGSLAMAILWLATRLFGLWPSGVVVPWLWPFLLGPTLLAWTQALTWMPYPVSGLRVILTVLWLAVIDAIIMIALETKASEPVMLAILAPQVPLAYLVARFAVARARRGEVPDWLRMLTRLGRVARRPRRGHFSSAQSAQFWFEWRQYGRSLPWLVGILLPFEAAMLFLFRQTPAIVFETLFLVLLTPPIMAAFVAATAGKSGDSYGVTPLIATRPLTNASLIAVKLKATMGSTLAAWLLILVAIPLALRLSGAAPLVIERAHRLVEALGMPRAVAIVLLGLLALVASTWKQLVLSLSIGLSGREWVVKASVFGTLTFLGITLPLAHWISEDRYAMGVLWNAFPWIAAVLAIVKISTAAWIAVRLRERRLVSDRALVIGAVCWDAAVFALFGLLVWILPTLIFRTSLLALLAILAIPLARLSAAPLALAWNRHR
jgi:hypothetical protein